MQSPVKERAQGRWFNILRGEGIPEHHLRDKHGPCPLCGGKDRFRFDDKDGRGTYFCSGCGAGDGFTLLMKFKAWSFREAASAVERIVGNGAPVSYKKTEKKDPRIALRKVMAEAQPVEYGDPVSRYLVARGLETMPESLLFHLELYEPESCKKFPAMLGVVQSADGSNVTLHRTYLDGEGKARIKSPRKIMPPAGTINGGAIRLYPATRHIGIAEGIETAIAAHEVFNLPIWSAMSANGLKTFEPPDGVEEISIFGDHDRNYTGQAAAYCLANRLEIKGLKAQVFVPDVPGQDWLDHYLDLQAKYHEEII